jgi:hypothetical protein
VKSLIDPRSGRMCEFRQEDFAVADPLFWLDMGDEVTTRYIYDGAKVAPPEAPALEEVRGLAIERVEHRAELELQAALGAKMPASVLLFQALPTSWRSSKQIRYPPWRNTRSWLPWSASAVLWTCSVRQSSWPSGGPGGFSAPPPSKRSDGRALVHLPLLKAVEVERTQQGERAPGQSRRHGGLAGTAR